MTPDDIIQAMRDAGVIPAEAPARAVPLAGGVSSDIWRIDAGDTQLCVKQALAKLKVEADWFAPVARNAFEVAWMETARRIVPEAVPEVLHHDPDAGWFAMRYLAPADYKVWKLELAAGSANPGAAAAVGTALGRLHAATAHDTEMAARFDTDEIFHAIRLEPYLLATAQAHPDLSDTLHRLADVTAITRIALVHGDVSPKNILIGPAGPVFLDAECAWYGDPAFDLAFCLNHLLLKCLWTPSARPAFRACFQAMSAAYADAAADLAADGVMTRAAHLLPGLFLARIDGKSPVEYLTDEADKDRVRVFARRFLTTPAEQPIDVCDAWHASLDDRAD